MKSLLNLLNSCGCVNCCQQSYGRAPVSSYNGYHSYSEDDGVDHDKVGLLTCYWPRLGSRFFCVFFFGVLGFFSVVSTSTIDCME